MLFTALFITGLSYAQDFKGHASGTFGILNGKVRVQYEMPLESRASYGMNMNYYLVNWTGPVFEPFIRIYGKKDGNAEGFLGQAKLIYGNLSTLDYDLYGGRVQLTLNCPLGVFFYNSKTSPRSGMMTFSRSSSSK